jgi:hypothetical protein
MVMLAGAGCGESPAAADEGGVRADVQDAAPPSDRAPEQSSAKSAPNADPFTGTFHATVNGERAVLTLARDGERLSAKIDDTALTGTIDGDVATGPLVDRNAGVGGTYEITPSGLDVVVRLSLKNLQTGEAIPVPPIVFTRRTEEQLAAEIAAERECDGRLIGHWRHTYTRVSGGVSIAIDYWLWLDPDGTCTRFSKMAGGDDGIGFESASDRTVGRWKTADKALYASGSPDGEPRLLGRYQVSGGTMLLTYNNGDKEIWERQ